MGSESLLCGIIIANLANTVIQYGFTHVSATFGLKFIYSLKHRHYGMFLAVLNLPGADRICRRHDELISVSSVSRRELARLHAIGGLTNQAQRFQIGEAIAAEIIAV